MSNQLIDMTGTKCGYLSVINKAPSRVSPNGNHVTRWHCRCVCGKELDVDAYALRSGNTKSCGCKNIKPIKDISGKQFGLLKVRQFDHQEGHVTYWLCDCECGNTTVVSKSNLMNGNTKSCGCLKSVGEAVIQRELDALGIDYVHCASFDSLVSENGNKLEFDFLIRKNGRDVCLLEYQGIQHYQSYNKFGDYQRNYSDEAKKNWCKISGISLHEIRYDEDIIQKLHRILSDHMLIPCQASQEEGVTTIP